MTSETTLYLKYLYICYQYSPTDPYNFTDSENSHADMVGADRLSASSSSSSDSDSSSSSGSSSSSDSSDSESESQPTEQKNNNNSGINSTNTNTSTSNPNNNTSNSGNNSSNPNNNNNNNSNNNSNNEGTLTLAESTNMFVKSLTASTQQQPPATSINALSNQPLTPTSVTGPSSTNIQLTAQNSFQQFKKQAKEKQEKQRQLSEQQEIRRRQKEQEDKERERIEMDKKKEREENAALESLTSRVEGSPVLSPNSGSQSPASASGLGSTSSNGNSIQQLREMERRRRENLAGQIDLNRQSDLMATFEERLLR